MINEKQFIKEGSFIDVAVSIKNNLNKVRSDKKQFLISVKTLIEEYNIKPSIKTLLNYAEVDAENRKDVKRKVERFLKDNCEFKKANYYFKSWKMLSNGSLIKESRMNSLKVVDKITLEPSINA